MFFEVQRGGKAAPKPVKTSSLTDEGWKEKDLENYLRENLPKLISDDLMVISQSRPYRPEADLLALDRQGDLWIFELKKVATSSDNLLQVMRYSQNAASLTVDDFRKLKTPFPATSIRAIADKNYPLLQTLRRLPEDIGDRLWSKCVALA